MNIFTVIIFKFQTHAWRKTQAYAETQYPIKPVELLHPLKFNTVQRERQWRLLHSELEMFFVDFSVTNSDEFLLY